MAKKGSNRERMEGAATRLDLIEKKLLHAAGEASAMTREVAAVKAEIEDVLAGAEGGETDG